MSIFETELPSVYLDALIEDAFASVTDETPVLINRDPAANDTSVRAETDISVDIATLGAAGTIDLSATQLYVNGVLAFSAGTFQAGFTGSYSNPQADVLRVVVNPDVDFGSEELVTVRVVSQAVGAGQVLDTSYVFTTADTLPPIVTSAVARDLQRVRVTFNDAVNQGVSSLAGSALNPTNWVLDRLGDYLDPIVSANVVAVEAVTTTSVDLLTDIPLTPGGYYRITVSDVEDVDGNAISVANTAFFYGWAPPVPEGRDFDLYTKLPLMNRQEDTTQDLYRFIACLKELTGLLLYDVDRFTDILDPDLAPEEVVDIMLLDLGNPFEFDLALADKRRLVQILVSMYQAKGTAAGIIAVIRFFMGLEVTIDAFNLSGNTWVLGDSELGEGSLLGTSDPYLIYSFTVTVQQTLTTAQRSQLRSIVEYMKPAHTHFIQLIEPEIPLVIDHLELGYSELGENWELH